MYLGQARIYQDRINKFLDIAKDLELKQLTEKAILSREDEPLNNEDDEEYDGTDTQCVSSTGGEIVNLDITANNEDDAEYEKERSKKYIKHHQ
jgi:hypothetical protein